MFNGYFPKGRDDMGYRQKSDPTYRKYFELVAVKKQGEGITFECATRRDFESSLYQLRSERAVIQNENSPTYENKFFEIRGDARLYLIVLFWVPRKKVTVRDGLELITPDEDIKKVIRSMAADGFTVAEIESIIGRTMTATEEKYFMKLTSK